MSFWTYWDTFTLKTPQVFFSKILTESLFKLDETVTSCKKLENFYGWFWKKNSGRTEKQTYEQTNRDYFIGPSFHGYTKYLRIDELKFVKDLKTSDHDTSIFFSGLSSTSFTSSFIEYYYWILCLRYSYMSIIRNEVIRYYQNLQFYAMNVMCCAIWYRLNNFKSMKNTHGGVLLLHRRFSHFFGTKSNNVSHIKVETTWISNFCFQCLTLSKYRFLYIVVAFHSYRKIKPFLFECTQIATETASYRNCYLKRTED